MESLELGLGLDFAEELKIEETGTNFYFWVLIARIIMMKLSQNLAGDLFLLYIYSKDFRKGILYKDPPNYLILLRI